MRHRTKLALLLLLIPALLAVGCGGEEKAADDLYTCPMHPTYVSDRPGSCPICNMDLVKKPERVAVGSAASEGDRKVLFYRNPMDPTVTSPAPAKDSMGMDYVPVYSDEVSGTGSGTSGGSSSSHAAVDLDANALRLAGVATEVAGHGHLTRMVRTVGSVVADERRLVRAQSKISGWVEKLRVSSTGQYVKKGEPAMAVYSPTLLAAQSEYLLARDAAARFAGSELPEVRRGGQDLLVAARRRLELLDVPESSIAELDRTRTAQRTVELLVPASGFVTAKAVVLGQEIAPGMELYTVTDLSAVWVEAAFYESEARWIEVGQTATLRPPSDPEAALKARIAYLYPTLDTAARTLTARFELGNPGFKLRPGMFVDVELEIDLGEGVLVPASAVLDSGLRQLVFVETAPGSFEPREVAVGGRGGELVRIVSGVAAGEKVAIRANFLLDSESRLRAAIAGAAATGPSADSDPHGAHP